MKNSAYAIIFLLFPVFSFCQLTDDFNDGDFTFNPAWVGDVAQWQVLAGQLNSNSSALNATFYLSTPAATAGNSEWRLYLNLKFSTSGVNYTDYYLVSDTAVLPANGNGYFVRIGGTPDEISLYRKDAGIITKIIDGVDGRSQVNASDNKIHIKVTRSASNDWVLADDNSGTGLNFVTEGVANDATYPAGIFAGISVTQSTASFFNKHFIDDVYAGPIQLDTIPPVIVSVTALSANQADVLFNEPLDVASAQTLLNYSVTNTIGNPATALVDGVNPALVHLTFTSLFTSGLLNTLTVTAVKDLANNQVISATGNFTYIAPVTAAFKDLLINEIFADPTPSIGLPGFEFVEIYNSSNKIFNLSGWELTDGTTIATLSGYTFNPGQFLIICSASDTSFFNAFGPTLGCSSFPSLNNDGDLIQLSDAMANIIDEVNYTDNWYHDGIKQDGGWTLELINPLLSANCNDSANWTASISAIGGTPGLQNSVYSTAPDTTAPDFFSIQANDSLHVLVCFNEGILPGPLGDTNSYFINQNIGKPAVALAVQDNSCVLLTLNQSLNSGITYTLAQLNLSDCSGNAVKTPTINFTYYETETADSGDVVINEILFNPKPNGFDYVEVYNRSQKVIDLNTLYIGGVNVETGLVYGLIALTAEKKLFLPGEYAVVTESVDDIKKRYEVANPDKLFEITDLPSFNDDEGVVVIFNSGQMLLDLFHYSDNFHFPLIKDQEGVSLERLSAQGPTQDAFNWHSAAQTVGFGTPTYINSENTGITDYGTAFNISPEIFSPDEDGYQDVVNILFHFDTPGFVANVSIFDSRGREIKKLARNTLLGNDGAFTWDGINENMEKAPIGIYIIYIEVFDTGGKIKKVKKTCVLGGRL